MKSVARPILFGIVLMAHRSPPASGQSGGGPTSEIASAIRSHQYERALNLARSALESSPEDIRVLTMEAIALTALGNDSDAL